MATVESATSPAEPERWLPVPGYEGIYECSSLGRVWSIPRPAGPRKQIRGRYLKPSRHGKSDYMVVVLRKDNTPKQFLVHVLVLLTFHGPRPPGMIALHGPGGKKDNSAANLCWGTHAQNNGRDRVRDGTDFKGERHPAHKLTEKQVLEIRTLKVAGATFRELAATYRLSPKTVQKIVYRRTWRHI